MAGARSSLGYLKPYRRAVAGGVTMMVATNLCSLGMFTYLGRGVQAVQDAMWQPVYGPLPDEQGAS